MQVIHFKQDNPTTWDAVVLLHGLFASKKSMLVLLLS